MHTCRQALRERSTRQPLLATVCCSRAPANLANMPHTAVPASCSKRQGCCWAIGRATPHTKHTSVTVVRAAGTNPSQQVTRTEALVRQLDSAAMKCPVHQKGAIYRPRETKPQPCPAGTGINTKAAQCLGLVCATAATPAVAAWHAALPQSSPPGDKGRAGAGWAPAAPRCRCCQPRER